ncbi:SLC13 family permease [Fulvivirga sediminis]|uniref:SLC13/DASS family transporter n=1 Tax=Fulvivirga sediminis TaxID=2803949 RepID=A0A937F686_9BACT|nr:DASS family sodium-coupled anion symporter [Fulvivirga sediminis]MBL3655786.1 SLC13/DASS family transporter [Fulvivirga sediminis]
MQAYFRQSFDFLHRRFNNIAFNFVAHISALKLILCIAIPLLVWAMPSSWIPLDNLTVTQHRAIFIFTFAAIFWIMEPVPIFATSIVVILLELVLLSDSGLALAFLNQEASGFGNILNYKEIIGTFASPIIILFLGGFFLAIAASKYNLDVAMARTFIKPFGCQPRWVMLGIMSITAVFSMFMSNTAATAMMLSILVPVLACLDKEDKGRIGFVLSVPLAANIGGIGTPIGTPPNAIAMKYLIGDNAISFSTWMLMCVPFALFLMFCGWLLILYLYPPTTKKIELKFKTKKQDKRASVIIYSTFAVTVALWLTDFLHGMNSYIIALIPMAVFLCLQVINKDDLKNISWDVLWLVSGGIALGLALDATGLAAVIVNNIPFGNMSLAIIFLLAAITGLIIANFMSHTATANLLIPIIAVIGTTVPGLEAFGGEKVLLLSTTLAISLSMSLPISTPPNALAFSTGLIETKHLAGMGIFMGLIGTALVFLMLYCTTSLGLI